jgi:hypothetical protein
VRKSVTSTGANFYECSMQAFFHHWQKCIPWLHGMIMLCSWKFAPPNGVILNPLL